MKINEVEKLLDVPMATIRFYEKEGLLAPQRNANSYRDYSERDVQLIKKIIIFRKIGISVEDIKRILDDKLSLQDALSKNIFSLQEKMKELDGAIKLCMEMQENDQRNDAFDTDHYWNMIHKEEEGGNKFFEIMNDVITYEKRIFGDAFDLLDEEGKRKFSFTDSIVVMVGLCALSGLLWSATDGMSGIRFFQGLFFPFILILIKSILGLPFFFIEEKTEKAAKTVRKIWPVFFAVFIIVAVLIRILS